MSRLLLCLLLAGCAGTREERTALRTLTPIPAANHFADTVDTARETSDDALLNALHTMKPIKP